MSLPLEVIPVEIQEKILSALNGRSLYVASQVCRLWFTIAAGLAKKKAEPYTLPETVIEVQQELACCSEHLWLRLLNYHSLQLQLRERLFNLVGPQPIPTSMERIESSSMAVLGCNFYVSSADNIEVFDAKANFRHLMTLSCKNGLIKQIVPIPKFKKLLVLSNTLEVYDVPVWESNKYNMKKIHVIPRNHQNELYRYKAISADDVFIAVQKDEFSITVFYMDHETNDDYFLRFINRTKTTHKIYQFALWKQEIIILLEIGEILWWAITTTKTLKCGSYQEIRYRNPVWLIRGRIFCSTITSRVLLGLWHLEAGTSYWLIGKPTAKLARCHNFDPVIDGSLLEVCSVFLKFRVLICGTSDGQLIVTYLSDSYFDNEDLDTNNISLENEFSKKPEIVLKLGNEAVVDIVADFSDDSMYAMVRLKSDTLKLYCFRFDFGQVEMTVPEPTEPDQELPP